MSMRATLLLPAAILVSCASTAPIPTTVEPSPIIAQYGDKVIRQAEVDSRAQEELRKLEDQAYELRTDTAERLALEVLVDAAGKKEGVSAEEWLERRLTAGAAEPTEAELRTVFERARERLGPEVTFEELRPRLRQVVEQDAKAQKARALFAQLKKEARFELVIKPPARPRKNVEALGPGRGPTGAPITIVEFADFECPFCSQAAEVVERVLAEYPGKVRLVFRHYPLSIHARASKAAEASACADEQGRFWEFHDSLFESRALEPDALKAQAGRLGLDTTRFERCLDSGQMAPRVRQDLEAGQVAGVGGTPAFFINGVLLSGAQPIEAFRRVIEQELGQ